MKPNLFNSSIDSEYINYECVEKFHRFTRNFQLTLDLNNLKSIPLPIF